MTFTQALQNLLWLSLPVACYAGAVRWRHGFSGAEILGRLGLARGNGRSYLIALAISAPYSVFAFFATSWVGDFKGSMLSPFFGAQPSAELVARAVYYGMLATGIPEELLFRGLIAGALFRRLTFWKANVLQAGIFVLPHLLILLVAPRLWPLAVVIPLLVGLALGWLRHASGSVWPAALLHGIPNVVGALGVMSWRG